MHYEKLGEFIGFFIRRFLNSSHPVVITLVVIANLQLVYADLPANAPVRDWGVVNVGSQSEGPCDDNPAQTCRVNQWPANNEFGMLMYSSDVWTNSNWPTTTFGDFQFESMMFYYNVKEFSRKNASGQFEIYQIKLKLIPSVYNSDEEGPLLLSVDGHLHTMPLSPKVLPWGHVPNAQYVTKAAVKGGAAIQIIHYDTDGHVIGQDRKNDGDVVKVFDHAAANFVKPSNENGNCDIANYWCFYFVNVGHQGNLGNAINPLQKVIVNIFPKDPSQNIMTGRIDLGKYRLTIQRGWQDADNPGTFTQLQAEDLQEVLPSRDSNGDRFELPQSQFGFIAGAAPGPNVDYNSQFHWMNAATMFGWTSNGGNGAGKPSGVQFDSRPISVNGDPGLCAAPGNTCPFFVNNPKAITYRDWIWNGGVDYLRANDSTKPPAEALWWNAPTLSENLVTFDPYNFKFNFDGEPINGILPTPTPINANPTPRPTSTPGSNIGAPPELPIKTTAAVRVKYQNKDYLVGLMKSGTLLAKNKVISIYYTKLLQKNAAHTAKKAGSINTNSSGLFVLPLTEGGTYFLKWSDLATHVAIKAYDYSRINHRTPLAALTLVSQAMKPSREEMAGAIKEAISFLR